MNFPRILKKRKGYIDRIKPFMQKSVVKVLTGQRRVGKSFLLYQLIEEILAEEPNANIIYVNLEDFTFSSLQTAEDLHSYIISHSKEKVKNYIFIDGSPAKVVAEGYERIFESVEYKLCCELAAKK